MKKHLVLIFLSVVLLLACGGCDGKGKHAASPSADIEVWENISGSYAREESSQYNNGVLQLKYLSNNCVMFEFRLMEGSETEDSAEDAVLPFVLLVGDDGVGRYESLPDSERPFSIDFILAQDGQKITINHKGDLPISPDGVYNFIDNNLEVSEVSAIAILDHLATATTSLNHNNGEYVIEYPEELIAGWFYPVQAVFKDNGAVLAKFLIAKDLSAVYRVDDDIEPVLIFGTAQPMLDAQIIPFREEMPEGEDLEYWFDMPEPIVTASLKDGVSLFVGQETSLSPIMPWPLPYSMEAASSDARLVAVDENGQVKALAPGKATINGTIYVDDGKKEFNIEISIDEEKKPVTETR